MTVPFADLFNKIRGRFFAGAPQAPASTAPRVRITKPSGERLSKTVLPRPLLPRETSGVGTSKSFGAAPRTRELPPALAKALEPKLERAITLQLSDFLDQIPVEYVKPVEVIDASRSVTLKASEIEKGMPERKPSISLSSLYQQIPEIFLRSVPPTDSTRVALPYEKVLDQFSTVQVRGDQQHDQRVPQVETPILQTTIEDTKRFGTKIEPVESSVSAPIPVNPATAAAIASAEPEPAVSKVVTSPSGKPTSSHPVISLDGLASTPAKDLPVPKLDFDTQPTPAPSNVPFQFPPNGTGASASERVPASSGPPVPPPSPSLLKLGPTGPVAKKSEPAKSPSKAASAPTEETKSKPIPFKLQENNDPKTVESAKIAPTTTAPSFTATVPKPDVRIEEGARETSKAHESTEGGVPMIALALKPILENVPVFQRDGDLSGVSEGVQVKFALDLIQSQLASGRVLVPAKIFQQALPPNHRSLFAIDPEETPVSLPLHEVLRNLPPNALKLRDDQQKFFPEDEFVTPISVKAKEDAERLQTSTGSSSKVAVTEAWIERQVDSWPKEEVAPPEEKIDGKQIVAAACALSGVAACELMFPDGLSLAGNLPPEIGADGLCAMAPSLLQRIDSHMSETKLGSLAAVTLRATGSAITFFTAENIYLAALHKDADALPAETRAELDTLVEKLSRTFAQPKMLHVDH